VRLPLLKGGRESAANVRTTPHMVDAAGAPPNEAVELLNS
jgi:hypothetical protein